MNKKYILLSTFFLSLFVQCECKNKFIGKFRKKNQSKVLCWTKKADPPFQVKDIDVCFVLNDRAYVGGENFWEYDPKRNVWHKAGLKFLQHKGRSGAVAFVHNGKAYMGTGKNISREGDIYEFNPTQHSWYWSCQGLKRYPTNTAYCIAFTLKKNESEIITYVGMGEHKNSNGKYKEIYKFDGEKFDETPIYFPEQVHFLEFSCVSTIDNTAYIINKSTSDYGQDFYAFSNPNKWEKLYFKAEDAAYSTMFALNGKVYVGLGSNTVNHAYYNAWHMYDPKTKVWNKCKNKFPEKRKVDKMFTHTKSFTINNKAYVLCENEKGKLIFYEGSLKWK